MNEHIAVLIPCYNEALTITQVINDFKRVLPDAAIYVYDNNSTDNTLALAKAAGATVKEVHLRGKGQVVRRMFTEVSADIYILVDGDATYDAESAPRAIEKLRQQSVDMIVCTRVPAADQTVFPPGHTFGNRFFTQTVNLLFGAAFKDILSGYRVFSRRFVKSFPIVSQGFEIEAEITIHAMQLGVPVAEIETPYAERPEGSVSKLRTIQDGFKVLKRVFSLFFYFRPLVFFSILFLLFSLLSVQLGLPIIRYFLETHTVPKLPTAILSMGLGLLASISLVCGIILDSISRSRQEAKRCWYLMAGLAK